MSNKRQKVFYDENKKYNTSIIMYNYNNKINCKFIIVPRNWQLFLI